MQVSVMTLLFGQPVTEKKSLRFAVQRNLYPTDLGNWLQVDMTLFFITLIFCKGRCYPAVKSVRILTLVVSLLITSHTDPYVAVGGMGLSPPFVMSLAVSSTGVVTAGTADGRLLIGFGAECRLAMKKRSKKWEGLEGDETLLIKIAEGPVVAL